jgi:hypothetical protein
MLTSEPSMWVGGHVGGGPRCLRAVLPDLDGRRCKIFAISTYAAMCLY